MFLAPDGQLDTFVEQPHVLSIYSQAFDRPNRLALSGTSVAISFDAQTMDGFAVWLVLLMTYKRKVNFGFAIAILVGTIVYFVGLQKSPVLAISVAGFVLAWAYVNDRFVLRGQPEGAGRPVPRPAPATLSPVLDKSPALICIHEMDGRLQLVNAAAATRLGYKTEELVGKNLVDIVKPIHHHELRRYLDRMNRTGIVCGTMMVTTRSGEELIWEYVNALSSGPDGNRVVFGLAMDVTDRFDSPQEAEQTERRFRQLAETIQEVFYIRDTLTSRILYVSPAFEAVWGRARQELYSDPSLYLQLIHEEDRPRAVQAANRRSQGERTDIEYRVVRPDGSIRWIRDRAFPMTDESGDTYRVTGIAEDITDRKKAQSVLATQYEIARILTEAQELSEATPQLLQKICVDLGWDIGAIWAVDRNGSAIYCSGAWSPIQDRLCDFETATRFAELPPSLGLPGRVWATRTAYWVTDLSDDAEFPLGWAGRTGGLQTGVGIPISLADRVHGVIEVFSSDRRERDEEVVKVITLMANQIAQFIERRQGEKELRQSEERFRLIAETVTEVFWMADQEAEKAFYVSPAYEKVWGRSIESFRDSTCSFLDAVLEEDRQRVESVLRLQTAGMPFSHEYRIVRPDGSIRWIWDRGFPVKTADGRVTRYVGVAQDITDRKRAEREMREGEERFRKAFDYAPIGMSLVATDGRWLRVNKSLCEITGYSELELLEKDYQSITHPEDLDLDLDQARKLLADEERFYQIEKRYIHKEGRIVWAILSVSLLRDSAGKPLYFVKEVQDISARKRMEEELTTTRDAALESARLKTEFLANMSHEIRTPMNGIIGMAELLFDTNLSPEQRDLVETIQSSGDSLLTIINDILDFSKIEAGKVTFDICDFDLKKTIEGTIEFFADLAFRKDIELASFVHLDIAPTLLGDPLRLRQVLINLLGNALKFTERGAVTLEVRKQAETPGQVVLRFDVSDTGIGIDRGSQNHLFNSFTQADGSATRKFGGTGLGLAISKRLVELMGGEIWVRSEPGKGSVFSFTARFEKRDEEATAPDSVTPARMRALVLAAEPALGRFIRRELTGLGADADTAATPADVIEKLRSAAQSGAAFHFVFIDAGPVAAGYALAREIKQDTEISSADLVLLPPLRPAVSDGEWQAAGFSHCVTKPIWESKLLSFLKNASGIPRVEVSSGEINRVAIGEPHLQRDSSSSRSIRQRILIAEDSPINQKVTRRQLQSLGYDADVVENGVEALEALKTGRYDCILMDCQMPVMDGFAATGELRKLEGESRHTPVVALTASAMSSDRDRCLQAGMDDFIPKPTRQAELASVLRKWIAPFNREEPENGDGREHANLERISAVFDLDSPADRTELAELIETFIGDTERNLEEMESAIDKTDLKAVQRIAHRTDGSCANMGAKYLAELADQLQQAVVSSPGQSRTIIESMRNEFLMVKKSLASEKDRLATEVG